MQMQSGKCRTSNEKQFSVNHSDICDKYLEHAKKLCETHSAKGLLLRLPDNFACTDLKNVKC